MTVTFTLDIGTEACSVDVAAEVATLMERVGELILEMTREGEDIQADLRDTTGDKLGTLTITEG